MNLIAAIRKVYDLKEKRRWPRIFWCIDLHDVIIEGKYNKFNDGRELAPYCKEVLQLLKEHDENCLILWTSSHSESITDMLKWLMDQDIYFDYINRNPECPNDELCDFSKKFYFNVCLEDKAGFEWKTDWKDIYDFLITEIYKYETDES